MQQAYPIGQSRFDVQVDEGWFARGDGVAVGHAHGYALLSCQYVFDGGILLKGIHDRRFAGARIAEDVLYPLGPEHLHERSLTRHSNHDTPPSYRRQGKAVLRTQGLFVVTLNRVKGRKPRDRPTLVSVRVSDSSLRLRITGWLLQVTTERPCLRTDNS